VCIWDGDTSQPEWEREAEANAEAWRGEEHANVAEQEGSEQGWRGDLHLGDWPEHLAGPEYRLRKKELEDDDGA
jgi:hypothetical protein